MNDQMVMKREMKTTCQKILEKVTQGVVAEDKICSPWLTNDLWLYSKFCGLYTFFLPPEMQTSIVARDLGTRSLFSQQQWSTFFFSKRFKYQICQTLQAVYPLLQLLSPTIVAQKQSQTIHKQISVPVFQQNLVYKNRQQARLEQKAVHSQLLVYHIVPRAQCCPYRLVGPKTWAGGAGSKRNLFHYYSLKYKKHTPSGSQLTKKKTDCWFYTFGDCWLLRVEQGSCSQGMRSYNIPRLLDYSARTVATDWET